MMEQIKLVPFVILAIAVGGIIAGAGAVTLSKFGESMDQCTTVTGGCNAGGTQYWNSTSRTCLNSSNVACGNTTDQWNATLHAQDANLDVAEQLPTVAIIGIMVIIISMLGGVFAYFRYFK
jgi:hypothetical protein